MYSWGAVSNGELGLGGLEKPHVALPSKVPLSDTIRVSSVVPGGRHSLMLTEAGELYSCGSNDFGQLGREEGQTRYKYHQIPDLS